MKVNYFRFKFSTLELKLDLSSLCKDASTVFEGFRFFGDTEVDFHEHRVFTKSFAVVNEDFDIMTQQALEVLFQAFLIILERQCVDNIYQELNIGNHEI